MHKKKISRLQPVDPARRDESERHYAQVHHTFARDQFRRVATDVTGYHGNRALGQFDLNGTFTERPDEWRFVITRWNAVGPEASHTVGFMSETLRNLFYADRAKCIGSVAACEVTETVLLDRLSGQTSLAKYLFRYGPEQFGDFDDFTSYYDGEHLPLLQRSIDRAYGLRLCLTNRVVQEAELKTRADGSMEYTGNYLERPSTYQFEEYYFDHDGLAHEFFTSAEMLCLLRDSRFGRVPGYQVEEKCGVDRR